MPLYCCSTAYDDTMTNTPRRGHPWSPQEAEQVLLSIQKNIDIAEIAKQHGRTVFAIKMQIKKTAAEFYFKGNMSFSDIQKRTRLTNYEMEEAFAEQRARIQSRVSRDYKSWSGTPCGYGDYRQQTPPIHATGGGQHGGTVYYGTRGQHGLYTNTYGMSHTGGIHVGRGRPIGPHAPQ